MKIGIDISQTLYENTGVGNYLTSLVQNLLDHDKENEYILFFTSLRKEFLISNFKFLNKSQYPNVQIKQFKIPQTILNILWNKLHIVPIEWFIGDIDVFITSDWTEPPTKKAKKATVIYDLIIYKHPEETASTIVETQKKKLEWVKKESDLILTISESSKKDIHEILNIPLEKIKVVYPGV